MVMESASGAGLLKKSGFRKKCENEGVGPSFSLSYDTPCHNVFFISGISYTDVFNRFKECGRVDIQPLEDRF